MDDNKVVPKWLFDLWNQRDIKTYSSVCLSTYYKNFNLGHSFCKIDVKTVH